MMPYRILPYFQVVPDTLKILKFLALGLLSHRISYFLSTS